MENKNECTGQGGIRVPEYHPLLDDEKDVKLLMRYDVMKTRKLQPWDALMKRMVWSQLGDISGKKMLDFGSGEGINADYFAERNEVTAVEPDSGSIDNRYRENEYRQLQGSTERIREMPDASFDWILCHNVLEYAADREEIVKEFSRVLKPEGCLSLVKHNRPGRVMQMVVLLNNFEMANRLLNGENGMSQQYGEIHYYEDKDVERWCSDLTISRTMGIRTFWDLQQNQELHREAEWQNKMIQMEMRVSEIEEYRNIAFFHHLLIRKKDM